MFAGHEYIWTSKDEDNLCELEKVKNKSWTDHLSFLRELHIKDGRPKTTDGRSIYFAFNEKRCAKQEILTKIKHGLALTSEERNSIHLILFKPTNTILFP